MKAVIIILSLFLIGCSVVGQTIKPIIKSGVVSDFITKEPINYIFIELAKKTDTGLKIVNSVLSNSKGEFKVTFLTSNSDSLFFIFKSFNYKTKVIYTDTITSNVGTIYLDVAPKILEEIKITASQINKSLGKLTYSVNSKDFVPNSKGNDALQKVPLVSILDNEIKVKGKSNTQLFLDGKTISLSELNLIPVENIKSIEVITNPSSQYDGEFKGSIVNIISKKLKPDMIKGSVGFSKGINNNWTFGNGFLSYKRKKTLLNISTSIIDNNQKGGSSVKRESVTSNFNLNAENSINITQSTSAFTIFHDIDSSQSISSKISYGSISDFGNGYGNYKISSGIVDTNYNFNSKDSRKIENTTGDFEYRKIYKTNGFLSLSTKYWAKKVGRAFDLQNKYDLPSKIINWNQTNDVNKFNEMAINILRNKPLDKYNASIEYGVSAFIRKYKSISNYFQYDTINDTFTNTFLSPNGLNLKQNIFASFLTYSLTHKKTSLAIGTRLEYVNEIFSNNNNNYFKVLPNISIGFDLQKNRYLEFSFNQKIKRPGTSYLNPTQFSTEPGVSTTGNIYLKPESFYSWSSSYNKSYKSRSNINLSIYYELDKDLIIENTVSSQANNIKRQFQNIAKQNLFGFALSFTKKLFKKVSVNSNSYIEYNKISSPFGTNLINNDVYIYATTLNISWIVLKKYSFSGFFDYTNKTFDLFSETSLPASTGLTVRRSFFKNKISASLRGMYFTNSNYRIMDYSDGIVKQTSTNFKNNNNLILRIDYNFGKIFNDNKRRNVVEQKDIKSDK